MQAYEAQMMKGLAGKGPDSAGPRPRAPTVPSPETSSSFQIRALWPAAVLLVLGLAGLVIATVMPTGKGGQYAVIAPPWYTLAQTIRLIQRAQGQITDIANGGGAGNIVIAHARQPGFVRAAYAAGAWAVIDPMTLRGCANLTPVGPDMFQGSKRP